MFKPFVLTGKILLVAIAASAQTSAFAGGVVGMERVESFCTGAMPLAPSPVPGASRNAMMPKPAVGFLESDKQDFLQLVGGFSRTPLTAEGLWRTVEQSSAAERAENVQHAKLLLAHVRERNFVSAQMVLLLSNKSLQNSQLGRLTLRLLQTIYAPYVSEEEVQEYRARQRRGAQDAAERKRNPDEHSHDTDDIEFNLELFDAKSRLQRIAQLTGTDFSSSFVRWHAQAFVYQDRPALQATRNILCSNDLYRALIPKLQRALQDPQVAAKP